MTDALLINEIPLPIPTELACKIGLKKAVVLCQIHKCLDPEVNQTLIAGRRWVGNSYESWQNQFPFWSVRTVRRIINQLEELGLLESFVTKDFRHLKFYTINYKRLDQLNSDRTPEPDKIGHNFEAGQSEQEAKFVSNLDNSVTHNPNGQNFKYGLFDHEANLTTPWAGMKSPQHKDKQALSPSSQKGPFEKAHLAESTLNDQLQVVNLSSQVPDLASCDQMPQPKQLQGFSPHIQTRRNDMASLAITEQSGQIDLANLDASYKDIYITNENIPPPPLTPPPPFSEEARVFFEEEDEEEEVFHKMLQIWNRIVQEQLKTNTKARLTPHRRKRMQEILAVLEGRLAAWKEYCHKIAGLRFLLGGSASGFKVSLDWALNQENACKVLEGGIYDKPSDAADNSQEQSWEAFVNELKTTLSAKPNCDVWLQISLHLAKKLGHQTYRAWFLGILFTLPNKNTAILEVDSTFKMDYLRNHFLDSIKSAVQLVCPEVKEIVFKVNTAGGAHV